MSGPETISTPFFRKSVSAFSHSSRLSTSSAMCWSALYPVLRFSAVTLVGCVNSTILWWSFPKRMKAISPPPNGQRPVSVSPRMSLYHDSERSRSVTWIPTCPMRLIANPFVMLASSLAGCALRTPEHCATFGVTVERCFLILKVFRVGVVARVNGVRQECFFVVGPELAHTWIGFDDRVHKLAVLALATADEDVADNVAVLVELDRPARGVG